MVFGCDHLAEAIIASSCRGTQAAWMRVNERTFDMAGKELYGNVDLEGVCMTGFFHGSAPMLESAERNCGPGGDRKRRLLAHVRQLAITRPLDAAATLYLQRLGDLLPNVQFVCSVPPRHERVETPDEDEEPKRLTCAGHRVVAAVQVGQQAV